jgi:metal-responsive CopG/Arc/MetJ family transcriptional regulator
MRRTSATYRLDDDLLQGLETVKERDGVPVSEQVRRALRAWLEAKGVLKAERKRAGTRRRS